MLDFKEPKPKRELDWQLIGMTLLPPAAVAVVTGAVSTTLSDRMPFGIALVIGLVVGVLGLAFSIAQQGSSSIEVMVASVILIVLTLIMFPVFGRAKRNAERRRAREALRLQSKPTPPALKP